MRDWIEKICRIADDIFEPWSAGSSLILPMPAITCRLEMGKCPRPAVLLSSSRRHLSRCLSDIVLSACSSGGITRRPNDYFQQHHAFHAALAWRWCTPPQSENDVFSSSSYARGRLGRGEKEGGWLPWLRKAAGAGQPPSPLTGSLPLSWWGLQRAAKKGSGVG